MEIIDKIDVLRSIANEFNQAKITWSLGTSMLLYFKDITTEFNDVDLMVMNEDVAKVQMIKSSMKL